MLKIGIVGCGAIGSSLAQGIIRDFSKEAELVALFDSNISKVQKLSGKVKKDSLAVDTLARLIRKSELVIECASAGSSFGIAKSALAASKDILIMSVGGVVGKLPYLSSLAKKNKSRIFIPSGAIAGIDALKAANMHKIKKVTITTTKNPVSFESVEYVKKKKINLKELTKDKVLFFGPAKEAVKYFPQNINVAAVLSLAGIGEEKTMVKIIASPETKRNIHEILIESGAGNIFTRVENILHPDNPKTSYLAVLSALATLRQIFLPVKIGT
ncbi:MAG: aspartate dehydrogenase [Candidatus Omnitrophica bacterium]|nr:aspartate dehydrogenase [Candidatus Omnitrophota bacterium]